VIIYHNLPCFFCPALPSGRDRHTFQTSAGEHSRDAVCLTACPPSESQYHLQQYQLHIIGPAQGDDKSLLGRGKKRLTSAPAAGRSGQRRA
jgi:hypothetical protein